MADDEATAREIVRQLWASAEPGWALPTQPITLDYRIIATALRAARAEGRQEMANAVASVIGPQASWSLPGTAGRTYGFGSRMLTFKLAEFSDDALAAHPVERRETEAP